MMNRRPTYQRRCFDFEIGHLKKSPCKECFDYFSFPACMDTCSLLDRIQTQLARTVLTGCNPATSEAFAVRIEDWRKING